MSKPRISAPNNGIVNSTLSAPSVTRPSDQAEPERASARCTLSKSLSTARMQFRSGLRCIGCMGLLPLRHTPGIQYCTLCRPGARRHTVYVCFEYRNPHGWQCKFFEWNLITPAGKTIAFRNESLLLRIARWGSGAPYLHSLRTIAEGIRAGRGAFYVRLTDAQHKKLRGTLPATREAEGLE